MKKKRTVMITVLVMLLIVLFQTATNAQIKIGKKDASALVDSEYADIDEALNTAEQQGKLAGQVDTEGAFATNQGGEKQQIMDSVTAQEELENQ